MTVDPDDDGAAGRKGPDAFRTISEVAEELGLPQHVLRFWESRFPQIKPVKRGGGRRYYRPNDVELLRGVKQLLYGEGYTIRGVQRILREQGGRKLAQAAGRERGETDDLVEASSAADFRPGPEMWAPGRRPAPEPTPDPKAAAETYDDPVSAGDFAENDVAKVAEPQRSEPHRDRLTSEQTVRLTAALDELLACRALLEGRR